MNLARCCFCCQHHQDGATLRPTKSSPSFVALQLAGFSDTLFTSVADILSDQAASTVNTIEMVLHWTSLPISNHANTIKRVPHRCPVQLMFSSDLFSHCRHGSYTQEGAAKKVLNWCPIKWFSSFVVLQLVYFSHFPEWFQKRSS